MECPESCMHQVCIDFRNGLVSQLHSPYNDVEHVTPSGDLLTRPTCHEFATGPLFHDKPLPCLFHAGHAHPKFGIDRVDGASKLKVKSMKQAGTDVSECRVQCFFCVKCNQSVLQSNLFGCLPSNQ